MSTYTLERPQLLRPGSVDEAVAELARLGDDGAALAGATWVMRAHLRGERLRGHYVALDRIDELRRIEHGDPLVLGALATHTEVGTLTAGSGPLGALAEAARRSAFPAVRNVATVGGNICARGFAEADLVPALLAAEAELELASAEGMTVLELAPYLAVGTTRPHGELLCRVRLPVPAGRRSWYERLTVRAGGEYAVASVAVSVDLDSTGATAAARVAVGSVAETPRRSSAAEAVLAGRRLDEAAGEEAGRAAAAEIEARDGLGAPAEYRLAVLPSLVRRAVARVAEPEAPV